MARVRIHDKEFETFIPYEKIRSVVEKMAEQMNEELKGKNPLFLCILNGSFMFAAEIFKRIELLDAEISFVKLASYSGTSTTGEIKELIGLNENMEGRTVVILEDIVDTGITISNTIEQIKSKNPAEVKVATLLLKPDALQKAVDLDYVGIKIPNDFIVGYGLDYNGLGRNLIDIYKVVFYAENSTY
ncbi:MAG: hypoxanthine phosphoribosyltransferase [Bacteroidetes bacterium GWF2_42_66]|nr:MAG: hypoxanthine phosphoribosyltransferase [Bacteroidetes bacterium GWA2_42_15]OFX97372.1 MAG: hypoxanthine phosphoribosyltransferase [Bacteroidetes bacterium GWE2_42_39]OFY40010.1 MAG: hypoxanthine phosphoribosyltransferase [Bacteroidetes bacterium GWF2_42_66]HBL78136.1 hypoxanthine phosphoribosyltransferase [Prolixibacteraceae bacterium]HCR91103.1 hypoxanthine phosphoribosyltransferase [Prolixibacteraceae bacterium]